MYNSFSLQQTHRIGNLDASLISRKNKINLMADFTRTKYENPEMKQSETANQLGYSSSILQRYRKICFHHSKFNQITPVNDQKRLRKLILTKINIVLVILKHFK